MKHTIIKFQKCMSLIFIRIFDCAIAIPEYVIFSSQNIYLVFRKKSQFIGIRLLNHFSYRGKQFYTAVVTDINIDAILFTLSLYESHESSILTNTINYSLIWDDVQIRAMQIKSRQYSEPTSDYLIFRNYLQNFLQNKFGFLV